MLRFRIVCVIAATATVIASVLFISYSTSQPKSTHIILRKHQHKPFHMLSEEERMTLVNKTFERSSKLLSAIRNRCHFYGVSKLRWDFKEFKVPRKLLFKKSINLLYSSNPKTGSSSFKKFFYKLDGVVDPHDVHLPRGHYQFVTPQIFTSKSDFYSTLRVGAIRNPAIRLISGFRDKILRKQKYMYDLNPDSADINDIELFRRFLELGYYNSSKYVWFTTNLHFTPQWDNMLVCSFPYNILIQYESGSSDIAAIQLVTNTTHIQYTLPRALSIADAESSDGVAFRWLSQLSRKSLDIIYDLYSIDYIILGYSKWSEREFPFVKDSL